MHGHEHIVAQRLGRVGDDPQVNIEGRGGPEPSGDGQHFASVNLLMRDTDEVSRHTSSRLGHFFFLSVSLKPSDAGGAARHGQLHLLADLQRAVHQRSGDHGSEACDSE